MGLEVIEIQKLYTSMLLFGLPFMMDAFHLNSKHTCHSDELPTDRTETHHILD